MKTAEQLLSEKDQHLSRAEEYYQECLSQIQKTYADRLNEITKLKEVMIKSAHKKYDEGIKRLTERKEKKQTKTKNIDLSKLSQTQLWSEFNKQGIESIGLPRDTKYTSLTQEQKKAVNNKREELLLQHKRKTDPDWIAAAAEWDCDPMTTDKDDLQLIQGSYDTILYNRKYDEYNPDEKEQPEVEQTQEQDQDQDQEQEQEQEKEEEPEEQQEPIQTIPFTQTKSITEEKIISIVREQVARAITPLREKVNDTKSHLFHQPAVTKEVITIPPPPKFKKFKIKPKARPAEGLAGCQKYSIPLLSSADETDEE